MGVGKRQTTWISSRVHSSIPARASRSRSSAARQKAAQLPQVLWSVRATISSPASAHMAARLTGGHVLTAAGRQAGMEVEIVVILHVELLFEITGRRRALSPETPEAGASSVSPERKPRRRADSTPPEGEKAPRPAEPGGVTGRSEGGDRSNTSCKNSFQDNKTARLSPNISISRGFRGGENLAAGRIHSA